MRTRCGFAAEGHLLARPAQGRTSISPWSGVVGSLRALRLASGRPASHVDLGFLPGLLPVSRLWDWRETSCDLLIDVGGIPTGTDQEDLVAANLPASGVRSDGLCVRVSEVGHRCSVSGVAHISNVATSRYPMRW
jgi:hypothetical protein